MINASRMLSEIEPAAFTSQKLARNSLGQFMEKGLGMVGFSRAVGLFEKK